MDKVPKIPIFRPFLPTFDKYSEYLKSIDSNQIYSNNGPLVQELEKRFSQYLGLDPSLVVACTNATLALQGAATTSPSEPDSKWGLPSWTFTASAAGLLNASKNFSFLDVDEDWMAACESTIRSLMLVLPFGQSFDPKKVPETIDCLIIDGAASFANLKDINLQSDLPTSGVISLHATKILPAGEGAIYFTNNLQWANKFRSWISFGMNETRESQSVGTNAKMSEYTAAVGLASLDEWSTKRAEWTQLLQKAQNIAAEFGLKGHPAMNSSMLSTYWILEFDDPEHCQELKIEFKRANIETREWWYKGCHTMKAYSNVAYNSLDNTNRLALRTIGIPFYLGLHESYWTRLGQIFSKISK